MTTTRNRSLPITAAVSAGILAIALLGGSASWAQTDTAAEQPTPAAATQDPQVLFVADVPRARIVRTDTGVRLSLPARASVTWFSDRPERHTGRTNLRQLVSTWSAVGFDTEPPNAALILTDRRGRERIHVVTLTDPRRVGSWIHATVDVIDDEAEAGYRNIHGLKAGRYSRAQLFIDDAAHPPCPNLVTTATSCIMTGQPVAFRSMTSTEVGTVKGCGVGASGLIDWQIQASALNVANGRIVHDEGLFANGRGLPGCSTDGPVDIVTVFPSASAQTYNQITIVNQSFIAGESTMGPGGAPSNPSYSPILLTYALSAE